MNAPLRLFGKSERAASPAAISVCALAMSLAGCAATPFGAAPVDPASPAAKAVIEGARADRAYPRFSDIPKTPTDVRAPRAWAAAVSDVEAARAELYAATAPETWTLEDTEAFAARARAAATPPAPVTPASGAEAFASDARERATPPPPPSR